MLIATVALYMVASFFVSRAIIRRFGDRPKEKFLPPKKAEIIYRESMASGRSLNNWLTRLAGASNCLRLTVTEGNLFIDTWFPFSSSASLWGL